MTLLNRPVDSLGIASCVAFIASAMIFYHVQKNILFMYPGWDLAFGASSFLGVVLGISGILNARATKSLPIFSVIGVVTNFLPVGIMLLVFAMGTMH